MRKCVNDSHVHILETWLIVTTVIYSYLDQIPTHLELERDKVII